MHFDLSDEQKAIRDTLSAFLAARFGAAEGVDAVKATSLDRTLWRDLGELGLNAILVPERAGGLGLGLLTLAVVSEVCGAYAVPAPVVPNALGAWLLAEAGTEAQRAEWLERLLAGEAIAAFALGEASGWLPEHWTLGEDPGERRKLYVERADEADLLIVGLSGGGLGLVRRDDPGVVISPLDSLDRTRPLSDVAVEVAAIEPIAATPQIVEKLVDALLVTLAADGLGAALAAQARAVGYAKERKQFGRLIGSFQALKHQLADLSVELEPARPFYWYAAHGWDTDRDDARRMASIVKAHIGEISVNAARADIEAHGGIGYTWEYPAHLLLKRAMFDRTAMGTPVFHRDRAAALAGWSQGHERAEDALAAAGGPADAQRLAAGAD